jgi:hypothetical protein
MPVTRIKAEVWEALKVLTHTAPTPYESLFTPVALPTTEPTDPQFQYTVAEADVPYFTPPLTSSIKVCQMLSAGRNTDAAAQTVYWRMVKWVSGAWSSVANGSQSVSANYYYTVVAHFTNVAIGDLLGLKLWATSANVNHDYDARAIILSQLSWKPYRLHGQFIIVTAEYPTYPAANPTRTVDHCKLYIHSSTYEDDRFAYLGTLSYPYFYEGSAYFLRINTGDATYANNGEVRTSSTYRPNYRNFAYPTTIRIRDLRKQNML